MATMHKRLAKEARGALTETTDGVALHPLGDDLLLWEVRF